VRIGYLAQYHSLASATLLKVMALLISSSARSTGCENWLLGPVPGALPGDVVVLHHESG